METLLRRLSVAELLVLGGYRFIHDYINDEHFPDARQLVYDPDRIGILSIEREMPTDWVLRLMKKRGVFAGTAYHALYYAASNPSLEIPLPIIALGTIFPYVEPEMAEKFKPVPHCVVLQDASQRRGINISDTQVNKWGKGCSFLTYTV